MVAYAEWLSVYRYLCGEPKEVMWHVKFRSISISDLLCTKMHLMFSLKCHFNASNRRSKMLLVLYILTSHWVLRTTFTDQFVCHFSFLHLLYKFGYILMPKKKNKEECSFLGKYNITSGCNLMQNSPLYRS